MRCCLFNTKSIPWLLMTWHLWHHITWTNTTWVNNNYWNNKVLENILWKWHKEQEHVGTCNNTPLAGLHKYTCCHFLEFPSQNGLEGQGQWPQFSIPMEGIPSCIFGANSLILASIHSKLLHGKNKFSRILRVSQDASLVQIWWFQVKSIMSCHADKVNFMDGRTDGQTQATIMPLRPKRPRGKNSLRNSVVIKD